MKPIVAELHEIREDEFFGPSTYSIVAEAASRNIPYIQLKNTSIIQLGYGENQRRIWATTTSLTSHAGVEVAGNKNRTKAMLDDAGVPVPRGTTVYSEAGLRDAIEELGFPIVTKPLDGNHGKGATIRIMNWKDAAEGLKAAQAVLAGRDCGAVYRGLRLPPAGGERQADCRRQAHPGRRDRRRQKQHPAAD